MADDVKLKIGGDTSELEKALSNAIKKIQAEADKLKLTPTAAKAAPGVDSLREAANTSRSMNQRIREEKAGLDLINRELAKKKAMIDEIAKQQANAVKASREELALAERLTKEKDRFQRAEKIAQVQRENVRKAEESANRAAGNRGGGGGIANPQGGMRGFSTVGIIGGITTAVVQGINQIAYSPQRTLVAGGSAVQNTVGRESSSIYNGSLPNELAWTREKAEAKQMADRQEAANRAMDTARATGGIAMGLATPALALSGVGLPAAGATGLASLAALFGSQRMRAQTTSALTKNIFPGYSKQQGAEYENLLSQQNGEDFRTSLDAKRQLDPRKQLAVDEYNANAQRDLDFQRQTGLNTQSFRGGFKNSAFDAGFTGEQAMGSASGILGAGGSTRGAVGNATLALQAGRNLDLTNSAGVLGKLSGSMGGADVSKEAFVKILAEGTRSGLDGSDFREENRKFIETAAQMVSTSGVSTSGGVEAIMSQFGKFFGDRTNTGIQAGQNAFDIYRQSSMATTGPRGTMRAAGMLTDPTISKLGRDSREALFNMPIDQLTPDNPAVIAMANEAKVTPEDLIKAQNRVTSKSANLFKNSDIATQRLSTIKAKYGVQSAIGFQGPLSGKAYDEIADALGRSNLAQIKEHPELGQDQRTTSAYSEAMSRGDSRAQQAALEDAKKSQLGATVSGRPEDETNKVRAEMSRYVNEMFMSMKDSIVPASGAAAHFVEQIQKVTAAMMALPENQRAGFANKNILPIFGPTTAPSAGSPNSGSK